MGKNTPARIGVSLFRTAAGCFVLVVVAIGLWRSQMLRYFAWDLLGDPHRDSFVRQIGGDGAADRFYKQYPELMNVLKMDAVVLLDPNISLAYDLRVLTGASSVVARLAFNVPDFSSRLVDTYRMLAVNVTKSERLAIIERYGVTHILLTGSHMTISDELGAQFGPPIAKSEALVLFDVSRRRASLN